jgi:DNA topoisomerase I
MKYFIKICYKTKNIYRDQYGNMLKNRKIIENFDKLYIAPNYKDIKFFNTKSKIYASGIDNKGRTQYSYNEEFKEKRESKKFKNLKKFISINERLDKKINDDLKQIKNTKNKLIAVILKLMKICNFRIGNEAYEKEYGSIGITTLQKKHIKFKSDKTIIEFIGKKGVLNSCTFKHQKMQSILKSLINKNKYLFSYIDDNKVLKHVNNNDVNEYLEEFGVTNKDLRMTNANYLFLHYFNIYTKNMNFKSLNDKEQKRIIRDCAVEVSKQLHNTVHVILNSYISKNLIEKVKNVNYNKNAKIKDQIKRLINA